MQVLHLQYPFLVKFKSHKFIQSHLSYQTIGFSQEMYKYGTQYWMIGFSYFFTQIFAAQVYVPIFHELKLTSAYEVKLLISGSI